MEARFARLLGLVERLLAQQPKDKNKLYSLHAPEVVCIARGKAHKPFEFGCKVGIAATNREGLFLAARAFEGNPYDGHTLKDTAARTEPMIGHAKCDGRLGRNWLLGVDGDKVNALLAAAGHNLRLILRRLTLPLAGIFGIVVRILTERISPWAVNAGPAVFPNARLGPPATSMA